MNADLFQALARCETDISGALRRFSGDESLYVLCLMEFLRDRTMDELDLALQARSWDEAFTAAHAMKGLVGNMGFVPLFQSAAELVVLIRTGRIDEIDDSYAQMKRCYMRVTAVIRDNINAANS